MMDSCRPRKVEPGFAQMYSMPTDLMTSTMKSEPGRSVVRTSAARGFPLSASSDVFGGGAEVFAVGSCPAAAAFPATSAATPAALPFRKSRRSTGFFLKYPMVLRSLCPHRVRPLYITNDLRGPFQLVTGRWRRLRAECAHQVRDNDFPENHGIRPNAFLPA